MDADVPNSQLWAWCTRALRSKVYDFRQSLKQGDPGPKYMELNLSDFK